MIIIMTCFSLVAVPSNAANDPTSKGVTTSPLVTSQIISTTLSVDVIGTSGTQSFTGVEEGDYLSFSGIGTALTVSIEGGSNETIPGPTGPQVIQVIEAYVPWSDGGWARVNFILDDGDPIGMDVLEFFAECPC